MAGCRGRLPLLPGHPPCPSSRANSSRAEDQWSRLEGAATQDGDRQGRAGALTREDDLVVRLPGWPALRPTRVGDFPPFQADEGYIPPRPGSNVVNVHRRESGCMKLEAPAFDLHRLATATPRGLAPKCPPSFFDLGRHKLIGPIRPLRHTRPLNSRIRLLLRREKTRLS